MTFFLQIVIELTNFQKRLTSKLGNDIITLTNKLVKGVNMNKEDFLEKIRKENEEKDPYENEVVIFAWRIGAIVAAAISIVVCYLEQIFWGKYNCGLILSLVTLLAIKYNIEAIKFKTVTSIIFASILSVTFILVIIVYIAAFINGWI